MSKLIGMIHMAKARLGMDDETYRMFLVDTIGKNSLRGTNSREQWRVMEELKRRGFAPQAIHKGARLVDDPQAKKVRALWLTMADCGIVRDRSEKALGTYVRRITGRGLADASTKRRSPEAGDLPVCPEGAGCAAHAGRASHNRRRLWRGPALTAAQTC